MNNFHQFTSKLRADYIEMINEKLDLILTEKIEDFKTIEVALSILLNNHRIETPLIDLIGRLEDIKEILDNPEIYVDRKESYLEFKQLILGRIANKISEINNMTHAEKIQIIEAQKTQRKTVQVNQSLLKSVLPPTREQSTLSEQEWFELQQTEFNDEMTSIQRAIIQVRQNGLVLQHMNAELKNNRIVVLTALQQNGLALQYASQELRDDSGFVRIAIRQNGLALEHASERWKNDRDIVLKAILQNGLALQHASTEQKKYPDLVCTAIYRNSQALIYADEYLKNHSSFILALVKDRGLILKYATSEQQNDPDTVRAAVEENGLALKYASEDLKNNMDIVCTAISQNRSALLFIGKQLSSDKKALACIKNMLIQKN